LDVIKWNCGQGGVVDSVLDCRAIKRSKRVDRGHDALGHCHCNCSLDGNHSRVVYQINFDLDRVCAGIRVVGAFKSEGLAFRCRLLQRDCQGSRWLRSHYSVSSRTAVGQTIPSVESTCRVLNLGEIYGRGGPKLTHG